MKYGAAEVPVGKFRSAVGEAVISHGREFGGEISRNGRMRNPLSQEKPGVLTGLTAEVVVIPQLIPFMGTAASRLAGDFLVTSHLTHRKTPTFDDSRGTGASPGYHHELSHQG